MKQILLLPLALWLVSCSLSSDAKTSASDVSAVRNSANAAYSDLGQTSGQPSAQTANPSVNPSANPSADQGQAAINAQSSGTCPDDTDLRGEGIDADYNQAVVLAQKAIAAQIQSTVSAATHTKVSSTEDADGHEIIKSSFDMETKVLAHLENAQDAKVVLKQPHNGKVKVVACMSRNDAMKPFRFKAGVFQDSLHLYAKTYEGASHPLQKNKTYKLGRQVYIRYVANREILRSFGMVDEASSAATDADYAYMHNDFSQFLSTYAMYFEAPENDVERSIFSVVSQNFSVVSGQCKGGLVLKAGVLDQNCKEGSLGIKCSATLTLTGSSCEGERYFELHASAAGTGKYDEAEAMDRLNKNIGKAEWFADWRRELNRWRMK
ncbi:hypothetical protein SAMN05720766_104190 [Fibrobacter sp. UWH9]|uniref:hypothetical protein n=1 Tax=Fibrobacter sp. UWH9 TaxID=1896213 RepID=UPI0009146E8B|nr:hypothetical protein [Fibrobacter sp. UWH9]SHG82276.1 hypothetical protein SAMN05720766_104190 [Fibrobacter sp. UWH9]